MSIDSARDLERLREIGRVVALALAAMTSRVRAGVTTRELDHACEDVLFAHGARATPRHEYGFPGSACISVNDEVVHGVPRDRSLAEGDIVTVDVTADLAGYVADAARTVIIPPHNETSARLAICARTAFDRAMTVARAGNRIRDIGRVVEQEVERCGFDVVRDLCGHGIGRKIHEAPSVPNHDSPLTRGRLTDGLVITVEPVITAASGAVHTSGDGWTIRTNDRSIAAHYEDTIVITHGEPLILTRLEDAA